MSIRPGQTTHCHFSTYIISVLTFFALKDLEDKMYPAMNSSVHDDISCISVEDCIHKS